MIFPDRNDGNKAKVEKIFLECGNRQVPVKTRHGEPVLDSAGNPVLKTERSEPQNYVIRFLPHAIKDGTDFNYVQTIRKHRDEDGLTHFCEGDENCRFCQQGLKSYNEYYSVIGLLNTDGKYSAGIYVLQFNFKFEQALKEFESRMLREQNIDTTSLGEDGCYISVYVFKNDSGYTDYVLNLGEVGSFDSEIKNDADIISFVNSKRIPDLEGFVQSLVKKNKKKAYNFMEISNSFNNYGSNEPDLIRIFNENGETVDDMISATIIEKSSEEDEVELEKDSKETQEPTGDYEGLLKMLED
jgi:hypothetical protein